MGKESQLSSLKARQRDARRKGHAARASELNLQIAELEGYKKPRKKAAAKKTAAKKAAPAKKAAAKKSAAKKTAAKK